MTPRRVAAGVAAPCKGVLILPRPPFPQECWCCRVRTLRDEGRESLPQSGLCALRTDAALLTNNLSNLPLFFNPPHDQCYVDLCIDCGALFIAAMFLESSKWVFFLLVLNIYLIFLMKPSPYHRGTWHVLREEHLPLVTFVVEMFRTDSEVLCEIFWLFRKLSLRDNWLWKSTNVATVLAHRSLSLNDASFNLAERKQSSVWSEEQRRGCLVVPNCWRNWTALGLGRGNYMPACVL